MAFQFDNRRRPALAWGATTRGMTLVELMVTLAVFAVLMAMAVPSFTRMVSSNRMTSQTNEFLLALNAAKSEAVRRGNAVTLRATDDANPNDFHRGMRTFTDGDMNGSPASAVSELDGTVLRESTAIPGTITVRRVTRAGTAPNFTYAAATSGLTTRQHITFNSRGVSSAGGPSFFRVCDTGNPNVNGRILQVNGAGRVSVDSTTANCAS